MTQMPVPAPVKHFWEIQDPKTQNALIYGAVFLGGLGIWAVMRAQKPMARVTRRWPAAHKPSALDLAMEDPKRSGLLDIGKNIGLAAMSGGALGIVHAMIAHDLKAGPFPLPVDALIGGGLALFGRQLDSPALEMAAHHVIGAAVARKAIGSFFPSLAEDEKAQKKLNPVLRPLTRPSGFEEEAMHGYGYGYAFGGDAVPDEDRCLQVERDR